MARFSWRKWFGLESRLSRRERLRAQFRPRAEQFEDRVVPSVAPFSTLAAGFTQELVASAINIAGNGAYFGGGYGFDSQGNLYASSTQTNHLYKIDMSSTIPQPGPAGQAPISATMHPIIDLGVPTYQGNPVNAFIGNFTAYPDGSVYAQSWSLGVVKIDLPTATITEIAAPSAPHGNWGIYVDPQLNSHGHHSIFYQDGSGIGVIDPVDHRYLGNIPIFTDGLAIDSTGNFLFTTGGGLEVSRRIATNNDLPVFQHVSYDGGSSDGISFATIGTQQVVITNDDGAHTVSEYTFPNNDFTQQGTRTIIANGGLSYGDQANVGADGYYYLSQWSLGTSVGSRYADGSTATWDSIVRLGPGGRFLPPTHSDNISLAPASDTLNTGSSEQLTATVLETDLNTQQTVPDVGVSVTFTVVAGPDNGQTFTGTTDDNGQVVFDLTNTLGAGADVVHAQFVDVNNDTQTSDNSVISFVVPPDSQLTNASGVAISATEGGSFTGTVATFSDPDGSDPIANYTATISWGAAGTGSATGAIVDDGNGHFHVTGSYTYAEEGSPTVQVTLQHNTLAPVVATSSMATVADAPLTQGTVSATGGVEYTTPTSLTATFTDANLNAPTSDFSGTINWGDGNPATTFTSADVTANGGGSFTVSASYQYAEESGATPYPITVTINDVGGSSTSDSGTTTVADAPLTDTTTSQTINAVEGNSTGSQVVATFTDGNPNATASDFPSQNLVINWGDNGPTSHGTIQFVSSAGGVSTWEVLGSHTYSEPGTYNVSVSITDVGGSTLTTNNGPSYYPFGVQNNVDISTVENGGWHLIYQDTYNTNLNANLSSILAAADQHPYLMLAGGATGSSTLLVLGAAPTPDVLFDEGTSNNTHSANGIGWYYNSNWSWGFAPAGDPVARNQADVLTTPDDNQRLSWHTLSFGVGGYRLGDILGLNGSTAYSRYILVADAGSSPKFAVIDAPLTAGTVSASGGVEHTTATTLSAAFTDANTGAPTSDFSGTINWGDGTAMNPDITTFTSSAVSGMNGSYTVSANHQYAEEGSYNITVVINDDDGSTKTDTGTTTVADAPLSASGVNVSAMEGASFTGVVATFTDPGGAEATGDYSATIDWGDGTPSTGADSISVSGGVFSVYGSHTYAEESGAEHPSSSPYTITVTVHHESAPDSSAVTSSATVSDPAVVATGGQSISAVEGALSSSQVVATFTDPGGAEATGDYSATIDWGDGTPPTGVDRITYDAGTQTFSVWASHSYAEESAADHPGSNPYTITVTVHHDSAPDSNPTSSTATVSDPAVQALDAGPIEITYGTAIPAGTPLATFSDLGGPEANDGSHYSASIHWGDVPDTSTDSVGLITYSGGTFTVGDGPYTYHAAGTYTITVTINHEGQVSTATDTVKIDKATPIIAITGASAPYDGSAHAAAGSAGGVESPPADLTSELHLHYSTDGVNFSSAAPVNAGTYEVYYTFDGDTNYNAVTAKTDSHQTVSIAKVTPAFSALSSPTITYGAASTILSGKISLGGLVPTGAVSITLNGVTKPATINADGTFSATFATTSLAGGSYTISYSYAGDANFDGATGSGTLTVGYGSQLLFDNSRSVQSGSALPIKLEVTDANGANVSSANLPVKAVDIVGPGGQHYTPAAKGNANPGNLFRYDPTLGGYIFNLDTTGLAAGTYTFYFTIGNDPTLHSLTFSVR